MPSQKNGAALARVSFAGGDGFGAVGDAEYRGLSLFGPGGIRYMPCEGDSLLLVFPDGTPVCAGVLRPGGGLSAGELLLESAGGAQVYLKNTGDVVINGLTITRDGRIVAPDKGE